MAVDSTLGRANVAIRATLDKLDGDLGAARGKVSGAVSSMVSSAGKNFQMLGTVALAGIGVATTAVAGLATALAKVTIDAAPVEGIQAAFEGIADSAGISGDEMLDALQKGSSGMIAQRDLMVSFNKAASLVSKDFATQLPDAMQYLSKVSAATGQDMGYMMDSLVVGVGRLSPMILDNLGIQVALSEATERAAEMFGVQADKLTKTQQQAGMMDVVLEKLAETTATMPNVTQSATAKMARMKAEIQDAKDRIGVAFLPVLKLLMDGLGMFADTVMPKVEAALAVIAPVIEKVACHIKSFLRAVAAGQSPLLAFKSLLFKLFPPEIASKISNIIAKIQEFAAKVQEFMAPIMAWISQNVELNDVLLVLGAAIATVVLPLIWGLITAVGPIILAFMAAVAVVSLLRQAWETDFHGMRTTLTDFWENSVKPAFVEIKQWLSVNIPKAIETARDFLGKLKIAFNDIKNAIKWVIDKIKEFSDKIKNIKIPDWLTPGSPTPLELGLLGIADAMHKLNTLELRGMQQGFAKIGSTSGQLGALAQAPMMAGARGGFGGERTQNITINQTNNNEIKDAMAAAAVVAYTQSQIVGGLQDRLG